MEFFKYYCGNLWTFELVENNEKLEQIVAEICKKFLEILKILSMIVGGCFVESHWYNFVEIYENFLETKKVVGIVETLRKFMKILWNFIKIYKKYCGNLGGNLWTFCGNN